MLKWSMWLGDIKDDHNAELYDKFRNMNSHVEGFCISCIDIVFDIFPFSLLDRLHTGDDLHVWCQKLSSLERVSQAIALVVPCLVHSTAVES